VAHDVVGRYYDPETGQFLSVDPEVQQTLQAYLYVGDDPVNGTDSLGLGANPKECGNPSDINYNQCMVAVRAGQQKADNSLFSAIDHLDHWLGTNVRMIAHEVKNNIVEVTQIAAAGACVAATVGVCAAIVGLSLAIQFTGLTLTHRLTLESGGETVLFSAIDIAEAGIAEAVDTIDSMANPQIMKEFSIPDKAIMRILKGIIATPDVIIGVSQWQH
jgi:hypothetical protein